MNTPVIKTKNSTVLDLDYLLLMADQSVQSGNFSAAINTYYGILYQSPNNAPASNGIGWLCLHIYKDLEKAEQFFQAALDCDPEYAPTYANYALLLSQQEDYETLNNLLSTALTIKGTDKAQLYLELGIMKEKQLAFDEAIAAYKQAIRHSLDLEHTYVLQDAIERCTVKIEVLE